MRWFRCLAGLLLLVTVVVAVGGEPELMRARSADVTVVTAGRSSGSGNLELRVMTSAGPLQLALRPATDLLEPAARQALAQRGVTGQAFRGDVIGHPAGWARMTRIGSAWLGAVFDGRELWFFAPARHHAALAAQLGLAPDTTLAFTLADFRDLPPIDGDALPAPQPPDHDPPAPAAKQAATSRTLRVSLVLDTEFQARYGAASESTAIGILNIADGFYSAQVDTHVTLFALRELTTNGTLTSTDAEDLMAAFKTWGNNGNVPFNGVAHLLSGKDFDGNTAGVAYIGVLCNSGWGYGVDQATWDAAASASFLAHELGHNYNAQHDGHGNTCPSSGYIMASVLNIGSPPTRFSSCSLDYFADYLASHTAACLEPGDVIYANGFD